MTNHARHGLDDWREPSYGLHGNTLTPATVAEPIAVNNTVNQQTNRASSHSSAIASTSSSTSISHSHRRTSAAVRNSLIPSANPAFAAAGDTPWIPAAPGHSYPPLVQLQQQYHRGRYPAPNQLPSNHISPQVADPNHTAGQKPFINSTHQHCYWPQLPVVLESSSYSCLPSFKHSRSPAAVVKLQYSINMASEGALTFRAVAAGLAVGAVLCFSNMYFGLQTGWVTMGSLQSAILGYGLFQGLGAAKLITHNLSVAENVIVQTTAVATATMPLAAGLVGIIPALGLLSPDDNPGGPLKFTPWQLMGWCSSLAFFGVFVAVPLRYQTVIREKLRFPSGTATASVIKTLHGISPSNNNTSSGSSREQQQPAASPIGHGSEYLPASSSSVLPDLEVAVATESSEQLPLAVGKLPSTSQPYDSSSIQQQQHEQQQQQQRQWARALQLLLWCFAASGTYSIAAAWLKPLRVLPVFDWLGLPAATAWGWVLQPSAGYIGQGMIMGPKTAWSMMAGAITGWAILGPHAKARGWAPGTIKDIETGAAGWLMWLGLALLLGDCFSELGLLLLQTAIQKAQAKGWLSGGTLGSRGLKRRGVGYQQLVVDESVEQGLSRTAVSPSRAGSAVELSPSSSERGFQGLVEPQSVGGASDSQYTPGQQQQQVLATTAAAAAADNSTDTDNDQEDATDSSSKADESSWLLSTKFWLPGLIVSTVLATAILAPLMGMPLHEPLVAVVVALLVALLAVRALGQTDLNPVSGVGKISQLVFAVVSPGAVIPNLVAGAIAEAGAQQAGDLMQDFKTAHLLGVPPSSQLVAMLLGSAVSVPLSVGAYMLYTSAWEVPGPILPAPTAQIWLDMAKLVNGGKLPDHIGPFCAVAAAVAAALPVLQHILQHIKRHQQHLACRTRTTADSAEYLTARKTSEDGTPGGWDAHSCRYAAGKHRSLLAQAASRLLSSWRSRSAVDWVLALLPSGVGFAVGMYLTPNWTVPRVVGSIVDQVWLVLNPGSHAAFMMVTASGLVLGEGCASIVTAVVHAAMA